MEENENLLPNIIQSSDRTFGLVAGRGIYHTKHNFYKGIFFILCN